MLNIRNIGVNVMIAGLVWQVVSLILFGVVSVDFIMAARKAGRQKTNPHFTSLRSTRLFRLLPYGESCNMRLLPFGT